MSCGGKVGEKRLKVSLMVTCLGDALFPDVGVATVKLLRRLIPQLTIGAVRFDLSIMVLLLVAFIGMQLAFGAAA